MGNIEIKEFTGNDSKNEIYELWQRTIGDIWQIDFERFAANVFEEESKTLKSNYFFALENSKVVGFIASKFITGGSGQIMLIVVDKKYQRKRIGRMLVEKVIDNFKENRIGEIQLGAGVGKYFWPGVPKNLPNAMGFFRSLSFEPTETSVDMIGDMSRYSTPANIYDRPKDIGITFRLSNKKDSERILKFEKEEFPDWFRFYEDLINKQTFENIVLAVDNENNIVGSTLLIDCEFAWQKMFDGKVGGFGALGVEKNVRNHGIGLALASFASETLKQRGAKYCFVGWTYLVDWYATLGYKVWRTYDMCWMKVE